MSGPIWMQNTTWRESGRQVKIGPLDGRLTVFIVLLALFPSKTLLMLTFGAMGVFYGLEYIGYTMPNAIRKGQALLAGKKRFSMHYWRQNKFR